MYHLIVRDKRVKTQLINKKEIKNQIAFKFALLQPVNTYFHPHRGFSSKCLMHVSANYILMSARVLVLVMWLLGKRREKHVSRN